MEAILKDAQGKAFAIHPLLEWELIHSCGEASDAFSLRVLWNYCFAKESATLSELFAILLKSRTFPSYLVSMKSSTSLFCWVLYSTS